MDEELLHTHLVQSQETLQLEKLNLASFQPCELKQNNISWIR